MKTGKLKYLAIVALAGCGGGGSDPAPTQQRAITTIAAESGHNVAIVSLGNAQSPVFADPALTYKLTVFENGQGVVTSSVPGIRCGDACVAAFAKSSTVTLTATAAPGYSFMGWSGNCVGVQPVCALTMTGDQIATASFTSVPTLHNRVDCVLDWVEKQYSTDYWPMIKSQSMNGYYVRSYSGSRNALAFNLTDSHLYYIDPAGFTYDYGSILIYLKPAGC